MRHPYLSGRYGPHIVEQQTPGYNPAERQQSILLRTKTSAKNPHQLYSFGTRSSQALAKRKGRKRKLKARDHWWPELTLEVDLEAFGYRHRRSRTVTSRHETEDEQEGRTQQQQHRSIPQTDHYSVARVVYIRRTGSCSERPVQFSGRLGPTAVVVPA